MNEIKLQGIKGIIRKLSFLITGINPEAILMVGDHYNHPLCPGLQPGPPSQNPWGLGQRYWSVSVVTWPPKPGVSEVGDSGPSSLMICNTQAQASWLNPLLHEYWLPLVQVLAWCCTNVDLTSVRSGGIVSISHKKLPITKQNLKITIKIVVKSPRDQRVKADCCTRASVCTDMPSPGARENPVIMWPVHLMPL